MIAARLTADDIYDRIDRLGRAFEEPDEIDEVTRDGRPRPVFTVDLRLEQLLELIIHLRDPHYPAAMELVSKLKRARISRSVDPPQVLEELRAVVAAWDAARQARRQAA